MCWNDFIYINLMQINGDDAQKIVKICKEDETKISDTIKQWGLGVQKLLEGWETQEKMIKGRLI